MTPGTSFTVPSPGCTIERDGFGREEDVEATIESILEEAEMTREEYDQITLLISLDGELRTVFEEVMIELEEEGTAR